MAHTDERTEVVRGVYVVLAETPNGGEDIAGIQSGMGWCPLVCTDQADPYFLRPAAMTISATTGRKLRLVHFTSREVVEEFHP